VWKNSPIFWEKLPKQLPKNAKKSPSKLNLKISKHVHKNNFELLKYLQQTMLTNCLLR